MSLIEEALRKQREETERTQPSGSGKQAPAPIVAPPPPPMPVTPVATNAAAPVAAPAAGDPPEKSRTTWRLLVGVGVLMLIAIAVLLWMFMFGMWLFKTPGSVPASGTNAASLNAATGVTARTAAPVRATAHTNVVAVVVAPAASTAQPPAQTAPTPTNMIAIVVPTPPVPPTVPVTAIPAVQPRTNPPVSTAAVEAVKLPIVWPRLAVSGIMGGGRTVRSTVIVNGQMLTQGDLIEGAKIIAIDKRGVTLSFSGETRTLTVGTSTD